MMSRSTGARPRLLAALLAVGSFVGAAGFIANAVGVFASDEAPNTVLTNRASSDPKVLGTISAASPVAASALQPFRISGPKESPENLARAPGLGSLAAQTSVSEVRQLIPEMRELSSTDQARFTLTATEGRRTPQGFLAATYWSDDANRQVLSIGTWTKVGEFNLVVPLNSPVTDFSLTTIDGLPALTALPSANVVGGLGPRDVFLYRAGIIYVVHGEGFLSDASFLAIVHNFIGEIKK